MFNRTYISNVLHPCLSGVFSKEIFNVVIFRAEALVSDIHVFGFKSLLDLMLMPSRASHRKLRKILGMMIKFDFEVVEYLHDISDTL